MKLAIQGHLKQAEIQWQQGDISELSGRQVSLRFRLRQASLYSYWISD